jgi:hypothetical protein
MAYMHEVGHALGLGHFNSNIGIPQNVIYNQLKYSIMSEKDYDLPSN